MAAHISYDRVSIKSFLWCFLVCLFCVINVFGETGLWLTANYWYLLCGIYLIPTNAILGIIYIGSDNEFSVVWRSALLGSVAGIGVVVTFCTPKDVCIFGTYMATLSVFHFSEYFVTSIITPRFLSIRSFMLTHSVEYVTAAVASWLEFLVESYLWPELKIYYGVSLFGLGMCIAGEALRKGAMFTAGSNFNHLIRTRREPGHELVTNGVYALCRHPSYAGWFLWSVGTQLILLNPVCLIGYTVATWTFFKYRIEEEEITLIDFFGDDYIRYQKQVPTGIPFISGFRIDQINTSLDTTPD